MMDVRSTNDVTEAVARLEHEPLLNIVLLKHIEAFRDHVSVAQVSAGRKAATLVLLDTSASAYDRKTYPEAAFAALISSHDPELTRRLIEAVPRQRPVVFKLASDADRNVVAEHFSISRTTSFLSFTFGERPDFVADESVSITTSASDAMLDLFESQGHSRQWLCPRLSSGLAFTCVLERDREPRSVCLAFQNHRQIWEVGGVVTPAQHRGQGLASRVVRTSLSELQRRGLVPRYQANERNLPSIRLATSIGLRRFLQLTHFRSW
ncbi:MAG: GNAT family N-acetyltransferase [Reyranella sp.]|nr:GNAT family N-acetyltransferase [Reyranella sp.]